MASQTKIYCIWKHQVIGSLPKSLKVCEGKFWSFKECGNKPSTQSELTNSTCCEVEREVSKDGFSMLKVGPFHIQSGMSMDSRLRLTTMGGKLSTPDKFKPMGECKVSGNLNFFQMSQLGMVKYDASGSFSNAKDSACTAIYSTFCE